MGQAKRRGTFEERKAKAKPIVRVSAFEKRKIMRDCIQQSWPYQLLAGILDDGGRRC